MKLPLRLVVVRSCSFCNYRPYPTYVLFTLRKIWRRSKLNVCIIYIYIHIYIHTHTHTHWVIKKSLCTWWLQYRKLQVIFKVFPAILQTADRQGQGDTRLTLTPPVIANSNYVIMVSDWNCLKYFCVFLYRNHQVHREFMITLYIYTRARAHTHTHTHTHSILEEPLVGQGLLIIEASKSHSNTPHSVRVLWTSDQLDAHTSTWQHKTLTRHRHPCPRWDSNQ
jgi:hypothetical protein